ncbi:MAG: tRNA (N(6)-L-threonylcarbamoyladenosine(37)-C(2))-methylthiotransferase MtaB [Actinomycetota bacterium]
MPPLAKVAFTTLGCRLNQAESDSMSDELLARGLQRAEAGDDPDLVVVNTCTVTREATKASRTAIRRAVRSHPRAKVVVIGCYAVSDAEEVAAIDGVDAVLNNDDKERFVDALASAPRTAPLLQIERPRSAAAPPLGTRSVRANLKVQTGCDEWCTFCIIPTTRGALRSRDEELLVQEARAKVTGGARELVLTGVHLGKYAYDKGGDERDLVRLFGRLLDIDGLRRVRLSSILSRHLTGEVVRFIAAEPRMCRYLHVPLQAGDDRVLSAMHRPYSIDEYVSSVQRARHMIPDLALATDVIVGFPGESDAAFEATLEVVRQIGFCKLHVFRYSARPGTAAAGMRDTVAPELRKERSKRLIALGNELRTRWLNEHLGRRLEVLVEDERIVDGVAVCSGQTSDFARVWFEGRGLLGRMVQVEGKRIRADGIEGRAPGG